MKEKNIFIGILIIALIGIGVVGYQAYNGDSSEVTESGPLAIKQTPPAQDGSVSVSQRTILYDATGFSPQSITVPMGTTIVFMNESDSEMWPASAPHPTHTDYSAFDAKRPIKQKESYTFTFDQAGTWKYHDHLNPTHFGSITVTK